jgi:hypothetical protein
VPHRLVVLSVCRCVSLSFSPVSSWQSWSKSLNRGWYQVPPPRMDVGSFVFFLSCQGTQKSWGLRKTVTTPAVVARSHHFLFPFHSFLFSFCNHSARSPGPTSSSSSSSSSSSCAVGCVQCALALSLSRCRRRRWFSLYLFPLSQFGAGNDRQDF